MAVIEHRTHFEEVPGHEPETRYEPSDVAARPVVLTGVGIAIVTLLCAGICYFALITRTERREAVSQQATPVEKDFHPLRPDPRLQTSPREDFAEYKEAQLSALNSYGWIDRSKGTVRIPIGAAMQIIAQKGIPPQKAPPDLMLYPPEAGTRLTGFEHATEGTK
jgi:hypothetical protein